MLIEDVVGVKIVIENEVDMENGNRGWDLEDIAGDSLSPGQAPEAQVSVTAFNSDRFYSDDENREVRIIGTVVARQDGDQMPFTSVTKWEAQHQFPNLHPKVSRRTVSENPTMKKRRNCFRKMSRRTIHTDQRPEPFP
jgi:hypothetical protein